MQQRSKPKTQNNIQMRIPNLGRPALRASGTRSATLRSGLRPLSTPSCIWRGTAPFCSPECQSHETQVWKDKKGDGDSCVTGNKILCCKCV